MRNFIFILIFLSAAATCSAQSISIFDIDPTNFPTMKAKFYVFDKDGKQANPNISDLKIRENGIERKITNISCPTPKPPKALSSVLVIDVSGSMGFQRFSSSNMEIAKSAANAWVNTLPLGTSECAITSYDNNNYLNQDFTTDRNLLLNAINPLLPKGGTDYDAGLINPAAGGLLITKNGKHQKIIVFLTDGKGIGTENLIINEAKSQNCQIYCVVIGMLAPTLLKNIANQTGGLFFENVTSKEEAEEIYKKILFIAQEGSSCDIEWESNYYCNNDIVKVEINWNGKQNFSSYSFPTNSLARLLVNPNNIRFGSRIPNISYDTTITLTAFNNEITVNNFKLRFGASNFQIVNTPLPFSIPKNSSKDITLRFLPLDSNLVYAAFDIETNSCTSNFSASGGFNSKKNNSPTLKLLSPNGKEEFVVGTDTVITWTGVSPQDTVQLDYSIDSGKTWKTITNSAIGLSYKWQNIPKPTSQKCLVRVKQGNFNFPPKIEWAKNYGGKSDDGANQVINTSDGGYAFIGRTVSFDTDVVGFIGWVDFWLVKLNSIGEIEWQKPLGGNHVDVGYSLQQTNDDGYIVAGVTLSNDNLVIGNRGNQDFLIYKLDKLGNIIWQKCFGGSQVDFPKNIIKTKDNGFIVIGTISSADKDIKVNNGLQDCWVVKLSEDGNIEWEKSYGGLLEEQGIDIVQTFDGGYIMIGNTNSDNGYLNTLKGGMDIFVIKTDDKGNIIWTNRYGGTDYDGGVSIRKTDDGGYAFLGETYSSNLDVKSKKISGGKFWLVKIDQIGLIEWENTFGGIRDDRASSFEITNDGGFILCGYTYSRNTGQVTGYKDSTDMWVVKVDINGQLEWQKCLGGTGFEAGTSVIQSTDNGFVVTGYTASNNFDVIKNYGGADAWVVKLSPDREVQQEDISDTLFAIVAPSPASRDIDMKQCIVNQIKDSVINDFTINNGSYKFRVDSIYFSGADANAFELVSGFPKYEVEAGKSSIGEFRFKPNRVGAHSAKVNIITGADTLIQNIIGEGIISGIEVINNIIDFGNLSLGKSKDSLQAVTIKNIGVTDVVITNIIQAGPNYSDFSIISNSTNNLLKAGDTLKLDLRFNPSFEGKVNGSLLFEFNDIGSPALLQLYGNGIDAKTTLSADSSSAFTRKEAKVILYLTNMDKLIGVGNTHISAELVFNKTMLFPKNFTKKKVEGDSLILILDSLPIVANAKNELTIIRFVTTLGNAEETALTLRNVKAIGADADITIQNGNFTLLGVCKEGGQRYLLGTRNKTMLLSISPNPATESIEIEYANADEGEAEIIICNILGQTLLVQKLEKTQTGFAKLDLSQIPTGQYNIVFKTETLIENKVIQIIK